MISTAALAESFTCSPSSSAPVTVTVSRITSPSTPLTLAETGLFNPDHRDSGEDALDKLSALVRAFLQMGCTSTLQLNILDRETLLRARENPDAPEYRTLIVRVWGFSAVFVELPKGLQEHVLARTAHGM